MRIPTMTRILIIAAGAVLLLPLIAMQFTTEVAWTRSDFIVAAVMLVIAIGLVELIRRSAGDARYRIAAYAAVAVGFLLIWAQLAVGLVDA